MKIYRSEQVLINQASSDIAGRFAIALSQPGAHSIKISAVGYQAKDTVLLTGKDELIREPSKMILKEDVMPLQAVTIQGQKPLMRQKGNSLTVDLENSPASPGVCGVTK